METAVRRRFVFSFTVAVIAQVVTLAILLFAGVMNLAEWNKVLSITIAVLSLVIAYNVLSFPARSRRQKFVRYGLLANPCAAGLFAAIVLGTSDGANRALLWIAGVGMIVAVLVSFVLVGLFLLSAGDGSAESY